MAIKLIEFAPDHAPIRGRDIHVLRGASSRNLEESLTLTAESLPAATKDFEGTLAAYRALGMGAAAWSSDPEMAEAKLIRGDLSRPTELVPNVLFLGTGFPRTNCLPWIARSVTQLSRVHESHARHHVMIQSEPMLKFRCDLRCSARRTILQCDPRVLPGNTSLWLLEDYGKDLSARSFLPGRDFEDSIVTTP